MATQPAKKVAAAVAAVLQHLSETEIAHDLPVVRPAPRPAAGPAPWGLTGRQESMSFRDLWQRRIPRSL